MRRHCVKWRPVHTALKCEFSSNSKDWKSPTGYQQLSTANTAQPVPASRLSMGMAVFVHQHTVSHPGTNIESSLILPFGEGDSLNSFGRKSAKICSEEFKKKKKKEQRESLPHGEKAGCRQAAYPPPASDSRQESTGCHGLWGSS